MSELEYTCRPLSEGAGEGEALLSTDALCFALCEPDTGSVVLTKASAAGDEGDA